MISRPIVSLLILCLSINLLTACADSGTVSEATIGTAARQSDIDDDLEATLEEAVLTLSTTVSDMVSRVNKMSAPEGTASDQYNQYVEIQHELSLLDQRIDELDDTLESNIHASKISSELYDKLHKELDSYEELIDNAEDKVDHLFGMDD